MAKQRKHHRKVKQQRFEAVVKQPVIENVETVTTPIETSVAIVKKDLRTTLITVALLVVLLGLANYLNNKYDWTLRFGTFLYDFLHIR